MDSPQYGYLAGKVALSQGEVTQHDIIIPFEQWCLLSRRMKIIITAHKNMNHISREKSQVVDGFDNHEVLQLTNKTRPREKSQKPHKGMYEKLEYTRNHL